MAVLPTNGQTEKAEMRREPSRAPQLSTDFLNRYSEALMLIEIALDDESIVDDLKAWRPLGYRAHFENSPLRCAASALAAYDVITPVRRKAFESVCTSMSRLVTTVTALLAEGRGNPELPMIVAVASEALRRLIARSTQFINANGRADIEAFEGGSLQHEIDAFLSGRRLG
ncbi:MAG: hypothetical protein DI527_07405 [Chelatococcus sp.]|nr:MAG: hypothetical protein DI527_07405 [Chelatococcus sp.]